MSKLRQLMEDGILLRGLAKFTDEELIAEVARRTEIKKIAIPEEFLKLREQAYEIEEFFPQCFYFGAESVGEKRSLFCFIAKWDFVTKEIFNAQKGYWDMNLPHDFIDRAYPEDGIFDFEGSIEQGREILLKSGFEEQTGIIEMFGGPFKREQK